MNAHLYPIFEKYMLLILVYNTLYTNTRCIQYSVYKYMHTCIQHQSNETNSAKCNISTLDIKI